MARQRLSSVRPAEGDEPHRRGHGFGTSPVFLASISTILGAIMFLRFGYAVGHAGLLGPSSSSSWDTADWRDAEIRIFAAYPNEQVEEETRCLTEMISDGRIPISQANIRIIPTDNRVDFNRLVETRSAAASLVILGFTEERLREKGPDLFQRHPALNDVLFVSAQQKIVIE